MTASTDIQAQLQAIRQAYCASLPEKLARIELLWRQLQQDQANKTHSEEFYRLLHSIAGSAETFGLPELTRTARAILQQLKQTKEIAALADVSQNLSDLSEIIRGVSRR
jgi:HPt (histidine-containing phosphotransfer) domain-containing protein